MSDGGADASRYGLAANTIGAGEIDAAVAVLQSGRLTMGEVTRRFEEAFARFVGSRDALMVNSGSSANLLAVEARMRGVRDDSRRWRPGDEVLVPALAWPTTVWPLAQLGLVPVLVDVEPKTLAIDLESARTTMSRRTVGMFLIHVLGQAADMAWYTAFCRDHDLVLLEDACESFGAEWNGRHVGTFGEMGTFSTYFSHHINTVEGGVVVTDDPAVYDDLWSMRSHGWVRDRSDRSTLAERSPTFDDRFLFVTTGYNVRPTELSAAIGLVQIERFDEMRTARTKLAATVSGWVSQIPWLRLVGSERLRGASAPSHSWMTLPFEVGADAPVDAATVTSLLEDTGIETRPVIAGNLARHPAMDQVEHRVAGSLEVSDRILARYFMIGCHPEVSPAQLETLESGFAKLAGL